MKNQKRKLFLTTVVSLAKSWEHLKQKYFLSPLQKQMQNLGTDRKSCWKRSSSDFNNLISLSFNSSAAANFLKLISSSDFYFLSANLYFLMIPCNLYIFVLNIPRSLLTLLICRMTMTLILFSKHAKLQNKIVI